ncbi:hypothetical protein HN51_061076 [Arachis hypogaea]|uniref:VQ domain-containing protein n=1 Tax=Arachis hypogaea TaxID=3818 RepID=A0A445AM82_ARAHY|nr:protein HAIKU1 [Arachis ipaensis]QHO18257.1 hypothetical protein DS421_11g318920 [Arachis hypogaea]RYR27450.1 hypothetical protein Ahy_B01g051481 [Arachis hypogaea]
MDNNKNRHHGGDGNLGVNKMGKNIRKSPLHQPNFGNNGTSAAAAAVAVGARPHQPQPQVYNISKNDFRDVVQQLTGSPSLNNATPPRPQQNSPKPQSMRLQKIRPPPLTPISRPPLRPPMPAQAPAAAPAGPAMVPYNNNNNALHRPGQFGQPALNPPLHHPGDMWANTAESPISAYMRYLQNSMMDPGSRGSRGNQMQPQSQPHGNAQHQFQQHPHQPPPGQGNVQPPNPPSSALLPNPHMPPMMPSSRFNGPHPPMNGTNPLVPSIPSPQPNGPPVLPSPTSQFLLPSPTGYMSFLSPRSPYPLLSPGVQFPTPLTPNFPFSPFGQSGLFGPGPQTPVSPGLFPISPSGFFQMASPRWRDQ